MGVPPQRLFPVLVLPLLLGCQSLWPASFGAGADGVAPGERMAAVDGIAPAETTAAADVEAAPEAPIASASAGSFDDAIFEDAAATERSELEPPATGSHLVRRGETLYSLARRYGTDVASLAALNDLADPTALHAGIKLRVPQTRPLAAATPAAAGSASPAVAPAGIGEPRTPAPAPDAPHERIRHVVRPGETLWRIARLYGVTPAELAQANGISDVGALRVGASLEIPRAVTVREVARQDAGCAVLPDVAAPPPAPPVDVTAAAPQEEVYEAIDSVLELGDRYLDSARFEETIDLAGLGLELLGEHWTQEDSGPRIARAELMRGIAQVALERRHEGHASFRRALRVEPAIVLGPEASPKIVDVFEAAREEVDAALASAGTP